jgi:hypothetical protein
MNLKLNAQLKNVDWSQASPEALELAVAEMKHREKLAEELALSKGKDEIKNIYYGVAVSFPRTKHAAKIALENKVGV